MKDANYHWIGKCKEYDPEGNLTAEYICMEIHYNVDGLKDEEYHFSKDGKLNYRYVYKYNRNGLMMEKKMFSEDDICHLRSFFYYTHGKLEKIEWINKEEIIEASEIFKYSEDGKTAVSIRENIGEWIHEYDDFGREIRVSGFCYSDMSTFEKKCRYDNQGHLIWMEKLHLNRIEVSFELKD